MRIQLSLVLLFFLAVSCSEQSTEDVLISKDSAEALLSKVPLPATDTTKRILVARGTEPGWYAEFYANRMRLQYNYGKDSIIVAYPFTAILMDEHFKLDMREAEQKLYIEINRGSCTESGSGETRERKILLEIDGKKLSGCATASVN